jgi:hypothetical protein
MVHDTSDEHQNLHWKHSWDHSRIADGSSPSLSSLNDRAAVVVEGFRGISFIR